MPGDALDVASGNVRVNGVSPSHSTIYGTTAGAPKIFSNGGTSDLWLYTPNSGYTDLILSNGYNMDNTLNIRYTPGTTGAAAGVLQIGQLAKQSQPTFTHGITQFFTNGTERLCIDNVGNVGIGTPNPQNRLVVSSGYNARTQLTVSDTNTCTVMLRAGASQPSVLASDVGLNIRTGAAWNDADAGGTTAMSLLLNGNVGIGTTNPLAKLHIKSNYSGEVGLMLESSDTSDPEKYNLRLRSYVLGAGMVGYQFQTKSHVGGTNIPLVFSNDGKVAIGTTTPSPTHLLTVNGAICSEEIECQTVAATDIKARSIRTENIAANDLRLQPTAWADHVLAPGYDLAPLSQVEQHIAAKGHLPGIPSAAQVASHGVSLAEMQAALLAKIEELTLHQIAQEKRLQKLESENAALRAAQP